MLTVTRPCYRVQPLDPGVLAIKLTPRVLVIRNTETEKDITYFGFDTFEDAVKLRTWMEARKFGPYNRTRDEGTNKPRKSERLPGSAWELKVHRCPVEWIEQAVKADNARTQRAREDAEFWARVEGARADLGM